ncbi:MAG: hypothetical protein GY754_29625, partial [bacterium]|nr:hypothetical protein [bacterium]
MNTKIESLGVYLPDKVLTTSELLQRCNKKLKIDLEKVTGISERRASEDGETSLDLAVNAAKNALSMSKYKTNEIEMIICTSLSRVNAKKELHYNPTLSLGVKTALKAKNAQTFDIVNACAGMFTGVVILNSFIKSGAVKCGIVVSGEQGSLLHESALRNIKHSFDGQLASLTLGDCGTAVILDSAKDEKCGFHELDFVTGAKYSDLCIGFPAKNEASLAMHTKPVKLHNAGLHNGMPYIKETLDNTGWNLSDVDYFIPHQTAERTIKRINRVIYNYAKTEVEQKSIITVKKYGNTATTSHYLALHEAMLDNTIVPGTRL